MSGKGIQKIIVLLVLLGLLAGALWVGLRTGHGRQMIAEPAKYGAEVKAWVAEHPVIAPLVLITAYVLLTVLMIMPLWWLQVLAGYGFGAILGIIFCDIAAAIGATAAVLTSRFLAADWFHRKVETRMAKVRELDKKLGSNGFLLVMTVRLTHFAPFGLSNYIFGVIGVSVADVALGTLLGNLPAITVTVTAGSNPRAMGTASFITMMVCMHVILFIPILLRYLHPEWFRKIGVE